MPGSGTRIFLEPDDCEAARRRALIEGVSTPCGRCRGRLTRAELHHLLLVRCEEELNLNLISAKGFGDTHPIASNDTPQGRAQNRRIEIVLEGPGA